MADDNVVRPQFGQPRKPPRTKIDGPVGEPVEPWEIIYGMIDNMPVGDREHSFLIDVAIPMQRHFEEIRGNVNKETLKTHVAELRNATDKQIRALAEGTGPLDWNTKPAFYLALLDAINLRDLT